MKKKDSFKQRVVRQTIMCCDSTCTDGDKRCPFIRRRGDGFYCEYLNSHLDSTTDHTQNQVIMRHRRCLESEVARPNAPKSKPYVSKDQVEISDSWAPNERHFAFAGELGIPAGLVTTEAGKFVDNAHAQGRMYKDWDAAFRTWLRNAASGGARRWAPGFPSSIKTSLPQYSGDARPSLDQVVVAKPQADIDGSLLELVGSFNPNE